jgi:hypothetical protein
MEKQNFKGHANHAIKDKVSERPAESVQKETMSRVTTRAFFSITPHLIRELKMSVIEVCLYYFYNSVANENGNCWYGQRAINEYTQLSNRAIIKARGLLESRGLITIKREEKSEGGKIDIFMTDIMGDSSEFFSCKSEETRSQIKKKYSKKEKEKEEKLEMELVDEDIRGDGFSHNGDGLSHQGVMALATERIYTLKEDTYKKNKSKKHSATFSVPDLGEKREEKIDTGELKASKELMEYLSGLLTTDEKQAFKEEEELEESEIKTKQSFENASKNERKGVNSLDLKESKERQPRSKESDNLAQKNESLKKEEKEPCEKKNSTKHLKVRENVSLTEKQISMLKEKLDERDYEWVLNKLSSYKKESGKMYSSDYLAITKWVLIALHNEKATKNCDEEIEGKNIKALMEIIKQLEYANKRGNPKIIGDEVVDEVFNKRCSLKSKKFPHIVANWYGYNWRDE